MTAKERMKAKLAGVQLSPETRERLVDALTQMVQEHPVFGEGNALEAAQTKEVGK